MSGARSQTELSEFVGSRPGRQKLHGEQFSAERWQDATDGTEVVTHLNNAFDAKRVLGTEPNNVVDNYSDNKEVCQTLDYAGIDYIVDTLTGPVCGVNHRQNKYRGGDTQFDVRKETGSEVPSEYDKVVGMIEEGCIAPNYASRLARDDNGTVQWVRVVDLVQVVKECESGVGPTRVWSSDGADGGGVVAWMFDYDLVDDIGAIEYEVFADE